MYLYFYHVYKYFVAIVLVPVLNLFIHTLSIPPYLFFPFLSSSSSLHSIFDSTENCLLSVKCTSMCVLTPIEIYSRLSSTCFHSCCFRLIHFVVVVVIFSNYVTKRQACEQTNVKGKKIRSKRERQSQVKRKAFFLLLSCCTEYYTIWPICPKLKLCEKNEFYTYNVSCDRFVCVCLCARVVHVGFICIIALICETIKRIKIRIPFGVAPNKYRQQQQQQQHDNKQ